MADAFAVQQRLLGGAAHVIFDVGAHVGITYEHYRAAFRTAEIHVFEPFAESFVELEARVANDPQCRANQLAVGRDDRPFHLHVNQNSDTNSRFPFHARAAEFWGASVQSSGRTVEVPCTSLDSYCDQQHIDALDILKLDVQGGELAALQGARGLLSGQRVRLVYMELLLAPTYDGQPTFADYLELMENHDYDLVDMLNLTYAGDRLIQADVIFMPGSPSRWHRRWKRSFRRSAARLGVRN